MVADNVIEIYTKRYHKPTIMDNPIAWLPKITRKVSKAEPSFLMVLSQLMKVIHEVTFSPSSPFQLNNLLMLANRHHSTSLIRQVDS